MTPETTKNQKNKEFKKLCEEALNKKIRKQTLVKIEKYKNFKNSKITPNHPKSKYSKNSKCHVSRPQIKKVQKTNCS
jgi:hypothetical protein